MPIRSTRYNTHYPLNFRRAGDENPVFANTNEWIKDYIKNDMEYEELMGETYRVRADTIYYIYSHALINNNATLERMELRRELKRSYGIAWGRWRDENYFYITLESIRRINMS